MADHVIGTDIKACSRSWDGRLICGVDNYGLVKLARYPCTDKQCGMKVYRGHSVNVQNAEFVAMDTHLITIGASDRCVFQWRHLEEGEDDEASDDEDAAVYDGGKGNQTILMTQTGMEGGESVFQPGP